MNTITYPHHDTLEFRNFWRCHSNTMNYHNLSFFDHATAQGVYQTYRDLIIQIWQCLDHYEQFAYVQDGRSKDNEALVIQAFYLNPQTNILLFNQNFSSSCIVYCYYCGNISFWDKDEIVVVGYVFL